MMSAVTEEMDQSLTVVIPTYQRRRLLLNALDSLGRQNVDKPSEVVVVVDGSSDGTADAIRDGAWPFVCHVIEQTNRGAAAARNRGAQAARGDILLFLDDDMEADEGLVGTHLDAHRAGAEVVVGAMPLHPESPRNVLSEDVGRWADRLAKRCSSPGYRMDADDIYSGHLSIRRDLFHRLGGFDQRFTSGGTFGNEDIDLAHRILAAGYRVVFRGDALSYQRFDITAVEDLRRWEEVGAADVTLARLHPDLDPSLRATTVRRQPSSMLARAAVTAPTVTAALTAPIRRLAIALVDHGMRDPLTKRLFARMHRLAYWLGVARSGGPLDGNRVRVLCWHSLSDLSRDPLLQPYGVPPHRFRWQLQTLQRARWAAVSSEELLALLENGTTVPRRAFLITFDDCYLDVETAHSLLAEFGMPGAAMAVTGFVGKRNSWNPGVTPLALADWPVLRNLQRDGWEVGSHSRTHPMLTSLDDERLWEEVAGPRRDLVRHGLPTPGLFAYPYGDWDTRVRGLVERAGYRAAFTVDPGTARRGDDRFAVPRIEVLPGDTGPRLRRKVRLGGRAPLLWLTAPERQRYAMAKIKGLLRPLIGPALRGARARSRDGSDRPAR
jgi:glycosyltransferase involved in cell wall biosynthesis/peptidoglycan/xylan/chitin deacetylase (PgdA/CDA1 family)